MDEALRRLDLLPHLSHAIAAVEQAAPERFAGGWIDHEPDLSLHVRLTGADMGLEVIKSILAGVKVDFRTGAPHSLDELYEGQSAITDTIHRNHPNLGLYVEVQSGAVKLVGPDDLTDEELQALSEIAGVPVILQRIPGAAGPGHTYGGRNINAELLCTTGFSTRDAVSGLTGVLTAGHCAGGAGSTATYFQDSSISYSATMSGKRWDANQDFAWYQTSHIEYPRFWDGSAYRDVTNTRSRNIMVGYAVCHYGRSTGTSCGVVDSVTYDPGEAICNGPCDRVWGLLNDDPGMKCWPGDSGGPYFFDNWAWGIYSGQWSGGTKMGQCYIAVFMTVGALNWDGVNTRVMLAD